MINIHTAYKKLKKNYSKNLPEILALKNKQYPDFVFERNPKTLKDEIPVFTLHSVEPNRFEEQLRFLSKNSYQTLTADEFYECIIGSRPIPERSVLLTFDDGWKDLRTVVYPLLKKYGLRAVCFIIPGLILEGNGNGPTAISEKGASASNHDFNSDSDPLCNWHEIREIHENGVIDFQSHSMYHNLIFVSSIVEDFYYPSFDSYARNLNVPLYRINGKENISRCAELGTPIYKYTSRFSGKMRYFDDEKLRNKCVEYVKLNGGEDFFRDYGWRKKLINLILDYREKYGDSGYFEGEEELRKNLYDELLESKLTIERKLPGKVINHFCYPWWEGSDIAVEMSKKAGYLTNFWGVLPRRRTNRCGDDPYRIARLLSDDYIFRLPGDGRDSLLRVIGEKLSINYRGLIGRLVQPD